MRSTFLLGILAMTACSGKEGPNTYNGYEHPSYVVELADGAFEQRLYTEHLVAEVTVEGERSEAANAGFRILANYIFGDNQARQKVAMTVPVVQSEKIAMTVPVTQSGEGQSWTVAFSMPKAYTLETLPITTDKRIIFRMTAPERVVTLRFSGFSSQSNLAHQKAKLMDYIKAKGLKVVGSPSYAFYNAPWSLPFMRRNEIIWPLEARE